MFEEVNYFDGFKKSPFKIIWTPLYLMKWWPFEKIGYSGWKPILMYCKICAQLTIEELPVKSHNVDILILEGWLNLNIFSKTSFNMVSISMWHIKYLVSTKTRPKHLFRNLIENCPTWSVQFKNKPVKSWKILKSKEWISKHLLETWMEVQFLGYSDS